MAIATIVKREEREREREKQRQKEEGETETVYLRKKYTQRKF